MKTRNPDSELPSRNLPDCELLSAEDAAGFYGIDAPAMRKRIRLRQDAPGWHKKGGRWVLRKRTFERWHDEQEGLDG